MSDGVAGNGGQGNMPPPKPWDRAGSSSGPSPFNPSSSGPTRSVLESAGVAKDGEMDLNTERNVPTANRSTMGRTMPLRPWDQNRVGGYAGYGSMANYNSGYGSGTYGSNNLYGGVGGYGGAIGGQYRGGLYGNNMYGGYGGPTGYGGMYNNGMGGPMGGYGPGPGGPYANGNGDPNDPFRGPPSPPTFWQSMLHMLFDRSGLLYGEIARFVLKLLGIRTQPRGMPRPGQRAIAGQETHENYHVEEPKAASGAWENVWGEEGGSPP